MSAIEPPQAPPPGEGERSLRAAELALGLVSGENRDEALLRDPALARDVARWEDDFARLADELAVVPPSPHAWHALRATLLREAEPTLPGRVGRWPDLLRNLWFWRGLAGGSAATAAALALLLLIGTEDVRPGPPAPSGTRVLLVSALLPRDGPALYVVTYDAARALVLAVPAATRPASGRVPQLWLVPNDNADPIALGLLDPEQPVAIALSPETERLVDGNAGLVVTLQPSGASTASAADGEVVAHGRFTEF